MTSIKKDPILVVLQLSGGNDGINTVVSLCRPPTMLTTARPCACRKTRR